MRRSPSCSPGAALPTVHIRALVPYHASSIRLDTCTCTCTHMVVWICPALQLAPVLNQDRTSLVRTAHSSMARTARCLSARRHAASTSASSTWRTRQGASGSHGRACDAEASASVPFATCVLGGPTDVHVERLRPCESCATFRAKRSTKQACEACGGCGVAQVRLEGVEEVQWRPCPACGGAGAVAEEFCNACGGTQVRLERAEIRVSVPAGVGQGARLRVKGQGHEMPDGSVGDLYVQVDMELHESFQMHGKDVLSRLTLTYLDALLGSTVVVETLDGAKRVQIAPGTMHGDVIAIAQCGAPGKDETRGSHRAIVQLELPKEISWEERKLLEELRELQRAKEKGKSRRSTRGR